MTLPVSGPISASMINTELGKPSNSVFYLNAPDVRALAQVPSGPVSFSDFRGKSSEIFESFSFTVAEVGAQQLGDKVPVYAPARRGYFTYDIGTYVSTYEIAGAVAPAVFRGSAIETMAEQHGRLSGPLLEELYVDRFLFELEGIHPSNLVKRIQIFYGASLYFQFDIAGAIHTTDSNSNKTAWAWSLPASWHLTTGLTYNVRIHYE